MHWVMCHVSSIVLYLYIAHKFQSDFLHAKQLVYTMPCLLLYTLKPKANSIAQHLLLQQFKSTKKKLIWRSIIFQEVGSLQRSRGTASSNRFLLFYQLILCGSTSTIKELISYNNNQQLYVIGILLEVIKKNSD